MLKTVDYEKELLEDLMMNKQSIDHQQLIKAIHSRLGHKVVLVDMNLDPFGIAAIVEWPNKGKIAIMIRDGSKKTTGKHLHKCSKGMSNFGCDRGIIYLFEDEIPQSLYRDAIDLKIELLDNEDSLRLVRQIDAKVKAIEE